MLVLSSPTRHHLWSDLWIRLYAHALLRESRTFPNVELCDESPDYAPTGLTDIWKGDRHGELVCIKTIRTQDPAHLREIESVRDSFIYGVRVNSVRLIPDIPSRSRPRSPSECASRHRGFGNAVSVFRHDSVDARWEHYPVHPNEPER